MTSSPRAQIELVSPEALRVDWPRPRAQSELVSPEAGTFTNLLCFSRNSVTLSTLLMCADLRGHSTRLHAQSELVSPEAIRGIGAAPHLRV